MPGRPVVAARASPLGRVAGVLLARRERATALRKLPDAARTAASGGGARLAAAAEPMVASLPGSVDLLAGGHVAPAGDRAAADGRPLRRDLREGRG